MGCGQSKPSIIRSANGGVTRLSQQDLQKRVEAPKENEVLEYCGMTLKYAYVSQRGYYPDSPDKPNQDSFKIIPKFADDPRQAFFAVFDGHGKEGHTCAWYVRDHLSNAIRSHLVDCPNNSRNIKKALARAHVETNNHLHADKEIDDSLSGTTSISIYMRGSTIYVSNVGDSRAIILSDSQSNVSLFAPGATPPAAGAAKLAAKPLSVDQTPYRKDERERVKKCGARVMSMDQIDKIEPMHENWGDMSLGENIDEGGDPPRVWSRLGDYPGTAFTRSFGDLIAEELGVFAEPEILCRKLLSTDRFLVIASDGVFEFLTNQMVAELIAQHADDPLQACKIISQQSYNLWLQYEVRTDDITIIIIKLQGNFDDDEVESDEGETVQSPTRPTSSDGSGRTAGLQVSEVNLTLADARPVRRALSREKKKTVIVSNASEHGTTEDDVTTLTSASLELDSMVVNKSEEETKAIAEALKNNFLFQHLNSQQRSTVIGVMQPVLVQEGDVVIRQGDQGDRFYVIDYGRFEVRVQPAGGNDPTGGNVVHVYESAPDFHPGFGELSLMYGKPRAATVIALTPGRLWALDRRVFRSVVMKSNNAQARKDLIHLLQRVELLQALSLPQFQRLADLLNEIHFKAGEYIIRQGEAGDNFYLIMSGLCDCTKTLDNGEEQFLVQRKEHEYFGERALLSNDPRAANVKAATDVRLLYIGKAAFDEVLGSLADIINKDRIRREALADAVNMSSKKLEGVNIAGLVSEDNLGPILMGSFGNLANDSSKDGDNSSANGGPRTITIRSFVLNDIEANNLSSSAIKFLEAIKTFSVATNMSMSSTSTHKLMGTAFLPHMTTISKDSNAVHLIFDDAVVADLSSLIKASTKEGTLACPKEWYTYITASVISALEALHSFGIIYRAVQPEGVYVTQSGKLVLMDFRVCKVGGVGSRTYTICGATDYLAPEQISQVGHSAPVDLWALGVMLYELVTGVHPFSVAGEVATYSKITSYGGKTFQNLPFADDVYPKAKALINKLVVPTPEARLGVSGGFHALKKHGLFESVDWLSLATPGNSPLQALASAACEDLCRDGVSQALLDKFSAPHTEVGWENSLKL